MTSSSSINSLGYLGIDFYQNPPLILANRTPTVNDKYNIGTQWADQSVNPPVIYQTVGAGIWETGASVPATTTTAGIVRLATNAEAVTGTNATAAITPASLTARLAAPGAIGATTPSTGAFTSITASTTITAGTGVTATTGNLTATNGNLVLSTSGNKLVINAATPTTSSIGTTAAMSGSGAVTITSTAITAASKIIYSRRTVGGTAGEVSITAQASGSATLTSSSATETSTFDYLIIN